MCVRRRLAGSFVSVRALGRALARYHICAHFSSLANSASCQSHKSRWAWTREVKCHKMFATDTLIVCSARNPYLEGDANTRPRRLDLAANLLIQAHAKHLADKGWHIFTLEIEQGRASPGSGAISSPSPLYRMQGLNVRIRVTRQRMDFTEQMTIYCWSKEILMNEQSIEAI